MTALSSFGPPPRTCQIPSCPNQPKHQGLCDKHHQEIVEETCECPPGAWHRPDCPLVFWPSDKDAA